MRYDHSLPVVVLMCTRRRWQVVRHKPYPLCCTLCIEGSAAEQSALASRYAIGPLLKQADLLPSKFSWQVMPPQHWRCFGTAAACSPRGGALELGGVRARLLGVPSARSFAGSFRARSRSIARSRLESFHLCKNDQCSPVVV